MSLAIQLAAGNPLALEAVRSVGSRAHVTREIWGEDAVVIRAIAFADVVFEGIDFNANFPECSFTRCEFRNIQSQSHFWAANNRWQECVFRRVTLHGAISPFSEFINCEFENCELLGATPYHTTFRQCRFAKLKLRGLRVEPSRNSGIPFWQEPPPQTNVLFHSCSFHDSLFDKCAFANVKFVATEVSGTSVKECSFAGAVGEPKWWAATDEHDPFLGFLNELMEALRSALGANSHAVRALETFVAKYTTDPSNKDYSACLYDGSVPDEELDQVEPLLDKLGNGLWL